MSDDLLTIAQTSVLLGVSERTLRRALKSADLQARLVAVNRHIGGRTRQVSLVSPQLLHELKGKYFSVEQQADQQASAGASPADLVTIYERLLNEQAQRIADLQTALEHERRQSERLAGAVSRLQERLETLSAAPKPSVITRLFGREDRRRK